MQMKYGLLDNTERKFISTNIIYLNKYLDKLTLNDEVTIIQTFYNGYKYRKYIIKEGINYTKCLKKENISKINKISKLEFDNILKETNKFIKKRRRIYTDGVYEISVDDFEIPNYFTLVEVSGKNLDNYTIPKGFVEVTNVEGFENKNIYDGFIKKTNVIIEGTDGVGKSETIKRLLLDGFICKDRESSIVSANMLFDIPMEERANKYLQFLNENNDILIFLINNDKEELLRRVRSRDKISDFDLDTYEYNQLYKDTYEYMRDNNMLEEKLYMIDCTNLNIDEQVQKVKTLIIDIKNI